MGAAIGPLAGTARDDGWFHHMDGWGGGWMWLWGTLMMLSWVAIIAAAVYLVSRRNRSEGHDGRRAREILDERYASGEITADEYRDMRSQIGR